MINFNDVPGAYFDALGRLGKVLSEMRTYQAAQLGNLKTNADNAIVQYNAEPDIQAVLGGAYIGILNAPGSVAGTLQTMAVQYLNRVVFRDFPRNQQNLLQLNTPSSVSYLIQQMEEQGQTVLKQIVTATADLFTANANNTGNGAVVATVTRPVDGRDQENLYAEQLTVLCTSDSYIGGATEGNEGFTVTGEGDEPDQFAFDWPLGSNCNTVTTAIDGTVDQGSGNFLVNSGYDTWTGNTPDNWTIETGTAGTQIFKETTLTFGSGNALRLLGDGATLTAWYQPFDDTTGTTSTLDELTQYAYCVWVRRDGVAAASGQLAIELVDSSGNVILDAAGNANRFTIDLTGLTVFYAPYGGVFNTPHIMPDAYWIRCRLTAGNALTSGRSVYFDRGGLGVTTQLYTGGPALAVFSGSTAFVQGDYVYVTTTNGRGSGGTLDTFQTLWFLLYTEAQDNEILLPSSNAPTISDTLITR